MSQGLNIIDRILLPFYRPVTIAKRLARLPHTQAALVLTSLNPQKSLEVLYAWPQNVRLNVLKDMGDYGIKLIRKMSYEEKSRYLVQLPPQMVKRLGTDFTNDELRAMMSSWSEDERATVFCKLPTETAGTIFATLELDDQISLIKRFKPWVGSAMLEWIDSDAKAKVLELLDHKDALDMFDRWGNHVKAEVLPKLSEGRRAEIVSALQPRAAASIMSRWEPVEVAETLLALPEERIFVTLKLLPEDIQAEVFPQIPLNMQTKLIKESEPMRAVGLVKALPSKQEKEAILSQLHPDHASSIRKLILIG